MTTTSTLDERNFAYIDNQNLYLSTRKSTNPWKVDMRRFRVYLQQKYRVSEAYLFMGAYMQEQSELYQRLQRMGYILIFREHSQNLKGKKKGNVDVDIVFQSLRDIIEEEGFDKVVLVSGDGDYKRLVDYLISKDRFKKILLPSRERSSSLYKKISREYYSYLDTADMRAKIGI